MPQTLPQSIPQGITSTLLQTIPPAALPSTGAVPPPLGGVGLLHPPCPSSPTSPPTPTSRVPSSNRPGSLRSRRCLRPPPWPCALGRPRSSTTVGMGRRTTPSRAATRPCTTQPNCFRPPPPSPPPPHTTITSTTITTPRIIQKEPRLLMAKV